VIAVSRQKQKTVLRLFGATFVARDGLRPRRLVDGEMSVLFLAAAIVIGVVA
jgi:hypothetical protein